jgi:hypothetical protein
VSRLMPWRTTLFSVRNSNDLMIRRVRVASVFGFDRFVSTSEISFSSDMNAQAPEHKERCGVRRRKERWVVA